MNFFRKIFGLNRDDEEHYHQYHRNAERNDFINDPSSPNDFVVKKGFEVFTDPLQIHQYFEQQMNELLKSFGFQEPGQFFMFDSSESPGLEISPNENDQNSHNLRDQFLKPGYVKLNDRSDMVDKDFDNVKSGDFHPLLNKKREDQVEVIPDNSPQLKNYFYSHGSSQTMKTIAKPNGSVETHCTLRDTQGNEKTTVCHKIGNKEYCVIKMKDKQGNEETTEQFVNMTEDEKDIFLRPRNFGTDDRPFNSNFPWDKFFK